MDIPHGATEDSANPTDSGRLVGFEVDGEGALWCVLELGGVPLRLQVFNPGGLTCASA